MKNLIFLLFITFSLLGFGQDNSLKKIAKLSKHLDEISGLEKLENSPLLWAVNDSGNSPIVYGVNTDGEIKEKVEIKNASNIDWEDLAKDDQGTLYIGDFGNNDNDRKDLTIYLVKDFLNQGNKAKASKIKFSFEDQTEFPSNKKNRNFGSEAFIYKDSFLYIFTKNRSKNSDGTVNLYQLPAKPGTYKAKKIDSFKTCSTGTHKCWITSATYNKTKNEILLLSEKYVWKLSNFKTNKFFNGDIKKYKLSGKNTQKESICYKKNNTAYIADEQEGKKKGRNLYELSLK